MVRGGYDAVKPPVAHAFHKFDRGLYVGRAVVDTRKDMTMYVSVLNGSLADSLFLERKLKNAILNCYVCVCCLIFHIQR